MSHTLDAGDRNLLIGAGILLVILVVISVLVSPPEITGARGFPSSYSPGWDGAKGAFALLKDLGYHVERWENSPLEIANAIREDTGAVLVLAEPMEPPTEQERFAILEFLQTGGRILATGPFAAKFLPEASPFTIDTGFMEEPEKFSPLIPSPLIFGAPEITMLAPKDWQPASPSQLVVYGNDETAAVVTYAFGKGRVIWWAAPTPLTNGSIRDAGNLALFLNSVGRSRRPRVLWDEYFHGAHGSVWDYFARTPVPWGIAQFGLVFLAILATYSRRLGPIRVPATPSRLSPLEFVETLGDLYHSAHAGAAAVRTAYQRLRFLLTRQLGLPGNIPLRELAESASRHLGWKEAPLFDTLSRSERAMRNPQLKDDESLELVQEIFGYVSRLQLRRSGGREGQTQ
jgi:Domain of unknown function (DUF4350)